MQGLTLALAYFLIVFGAGFLLGTIRVLLLLPVLGERAAELLEMPFMLICKLPRQGDTANGELLASSWARYSVGGSPASASWGRSSL